MVAESGAILYTIEAALGDRDFVVTSPDNPFDIQLRTWHEIWFKEALINVAVTRLPWNWKKVAWIDGDVQWARTDWADETRHLLEHYPLIQMWSHLHDLDQNYELIGTIRSFADVWLEFGDMPPEQIPIGGNGGSYYMDAKRRGLRRGYPGAPGLAWACRREWWDQMGGLIDYQLCGAGDWYMAHAMCGKLRPILRNPDERLSLMMLEWEERARRGKWHERPLMGNLGVLKGVVLHYFHGRKTHRRYQTREQILRRNGYNPDLDLKRDYQGLYQLTDRVPQLRRDLQRYFRERNEDEHL
jgi:hypothetical protein